MWKSRLKTSTCVPIEVARAVRRAVQACFTRVRFMKRPCVRRFFVLGSSIQMAASARPVQQHHLRVRERIFSAERKPYSSTGSWKYA